MGLIQCIELHHLFLRAEEKTPWVISWVTPVLMHILREKVLNDVKPI